MKDCEKLLKKVQQALAAFFASQKRGSMDGDTIAAEGTVANGAKRLKRHSEHVTGVSPMSDDESQDNRPLNERRKVAKMVFSDEDEDDVTARGKADDTEASDSLMIL